MARSSRFSPEVWGRAVRMVWEHQAQHASRWAAITSIADKVGWEAETLGHGGGRASARRGIAPG